MLELGDTDELGELGDDDIDEDEDEESLLVVLVVFRSNAPLVEELAEI